MNSSLLVSVKSFITHIMYYRLAPSTSKIFKNGPIDGRRFGKNREKLQWYIFYSQPHNIVVIAVHVWFEYGRRATRPRPAVHIRREGCFSITSVYTLWIYACAALAAVEIINLTVENRLKNRLGRWVPSLFFEITWRLWITFAYNLNGASLYRSTKSVCSEFIIKVQVALRTRCTHVCTYK